MTLVTFIRCDAEGCDEQTEPGNTEWGMVVRANADPFSTKSGSLHFCPAHTDGPEHLAALRARRDHE